MLDLSSQPSFHPELLPRRAELLTWLLALIVLVTWWILQASSARFASTAFILFGFLIFAAFGTSLGNWMDRHTELHLDQEGLRFKNGLRNVRLSWPDIDQVRVYPAQAGARRVQVMGGKQHFEFRTLAELRLNDQVKGRSGFADGDAILETILQAAGLKQRDDDLPYTYYARG